MAVFNIRGTNGSGKTTLVRGFLEGSPYQKVQLTDTVPGYVTAEGIVLVGKYENACGGCDTIKTQQAAKDAIVAATKLGKHVLFEGNLISTIFQPWVDFSNNVQPFTWVFLDTPFEECLRRVYVRNGGKPVEEDQVKAKFNTIEKMRLKAAAQGQVVGVLPYGDEREAFRRFWGDQ